MSTFTKRPLRRPSGCALALCVRICLLPAWIAASRGFQVMLIFSCFGPRSPTLPYHSSDEGPQISGVYSHHWTVSNALPIKSLHFNAGWIMFVALLSLQKALSHIPLWPPCTWYKWLDPPLFPQAPWQHNLAFTSWPFRFNLQRGFLGMCQPMLDEAGQLPLSWLYTATSEWKT